VTQAENITDDLVEAWFEEPGSPFSNEIAIGLLTGTLDIEILRKDILKFKETYTGLSKRDLDWSCLR